MKIELLKAGVVNRVITTSTANDGNYDWTIPSTQTLGTDYKIRITSTTYPEITDSSNANFAITTAEELTVTSPNGGENLGRRHNPRDNMDFHRKLEGICQDRATEGRSAEHGHFQHNS